MTAVRAVRFTPDDAPAWNEFVRASRNGTFLFDRGYMDYHADRFEDRSLLFFDSADRLVAVLPAHRRGTELISHGGLTYGGFVT
ncbi:MAG TPA: GNAT family N-acetyltransferase, partial [Thermoanaerobaculia bacterium]|nr:GNAT family N-acetyltransferase [Thermoanaerobaculia bacterium]